MLYASDVPVSVPVRNPFRSTNPFVRLTNTGPLTPPEDWVSVHVMRPVRP